MTINLNHFIAIFLSSKKKFFNVNKIIGIKTNRTKIFEYNAKTVETQKGSLFLFIKKKIETKVRNIEKMYVFTKVELGSKKGLKKVRTDAYKPVFLLQTCEAIKKTITHVRKNNIKENILSVCSSDPAKKVIK